MHFIVTKYLEPTTIELKNKGDRLLKNLSKRPEIGKYL